MQKTKVLIVEDEAIIGETLRYLLINLGYEVVGIIEAGEAVVEANNYYCPDIIMMDIRLRGQMDGIMAAHLIKKESTSTPVIFLTAHSDQETTARAMKTEPHGYILKPFDEREIYICIEMALYKSKMERKLYEKEKIFETTLSCIGDPVIITDGAGKITFCNFVIEQYINISREKYLNSFWDEHFYFTQGESGNNSAYNPLKEVLLQGISITLPTGAKLISKNDAQQIDVKNSTISPVIDDQGHLMGAVIVLHIGE